MKFKIQQTFLAFGDMLSAQYQLSLFSDGDQQYHFMGSYKDVAAARGAAQSVVDQKEPDIEFEL